MRSTWINSRVLIVSTGAPSSMRIFDFQHVKSQAATLVQGMGPDELDQKHRTLGFVSLKRLATSRQSHQQPGTALGDMLDLFDE